MRIGSPTSRGPGVGGLTHSNYGGTNTAYVNPSAIADARTSFYLNLVGATLIFTTTTCDLTCPSGPGKRIFRSRKSTSGNN